MRGRKEGGGRGNGVGQEEKEGRREKLCGEDPEKKKKEKEEEEVERRARLNRRHKTAQEEITVFLSRAPCCVIRTRVV